MEFSLVDSLDLVVLELEDEVERLDVVLVVEVEEEVDSEELLTKVELVVVKLVAGLELKLLFEVVLEVSETEEVWPELEGDCPWVRRTYPATAPTMTMTSTATAITLGAMPRFPARILDSGRRGLFKTGSLGPHRGASSYSLRPSRRLLS